MGVIINSVKNIQIILNENKCYFRIIKFLISKLLSGKSKITSSLKLIVTYAHKTCLKTIDNLLYGKGNQKTLMDRCKMVNKWKNTMKNCMAIWKT